MSLNDVNCTFCGQCIERCPVGALREKDSTKAVWKKLKDDSTLEVTALVELRKKHKVQIQDKDIKKLYEAYVEKNTK